jgi:hypothetical protein
LDHTSTGIAAASAALRSPSGAASEKAENPLSTSASPCRIVSTGGLLSTGCPYLPPRAHDIRKP